MSSRLDPAAWRRLKDVFNSAVALSPSDRADYLKAACQGDADLRREVERLLASHDEAGSFLDAAGTELDAPDTTAMLAGRQIGPYQLRSLVGIGGMGEVYKARDTRLDRTVAIKILARHAGRDPQAHERFAREARAVAALNHPHICTLHDVGHHDGIDFLVIEYIDGETLTTRLAKRPLPIAQALQYAVQIASALDNAHRAGIIHRDLKPGNVMLTSTGAKILDFGLAKSFAPVGAVPSLTTPVGPNLAPDLTMPGTILGTVSYMAPEQLEGKHSDARTDIFAFGTLLFEMLTGKKAFGGSSAASVIAAILDHEPPLVSSLKATVHSSLDHIVKRCLAKDPDQRWQSIRDVMLELQSVNDSPPLGAVVTRASRWAFVAAWLGWILAGGLLVALVVTFAAHSSNVSQQRHTTRLSILPPQQTAFLGGYGAPHLALSPDGQRLAFVPTAVGGRTLLWIRAIDSLTATPLSGTDGATFPFWSPDGRQIGFFADGKLKTIDPAESTPVVICDAPDSRGGAWSRDGVIVFSPSLHGPLYRVSAGRGGQPIAVTALDDSRQEVSHRLPSFLPDGRHFLFFVQSGRPEHNVVYVGSLDSKEPRRLDIVGSKAAYGGGFVVFGRDQSLMAQRFDPARLQLAGEPIALGDHVGFRTTVGGDSLFSVAENGTLSYWSGEQLLTRLNWFDRKGESLGTLGVPAQHYSLALSPDGTRVAVEMIDANTRVGGIWTIDVSSGIHSRSTFSQSWDWGPVWAPDNGRIAFGSLRFGPSSLHMKTTASTKAEELVLKTSEFIGVTDWSPDGKHILYQSVTTGKLGVLPVEGERSPKLLLGTDFSEANGSLSPDGRWLAYTSNESGVWDVYVQPFPSLDQKWRVSPDGGSRPKWRADGKELFYVAPDQRLMAVAVTADSNFSATRPTPLFQLRVVPMPPTPRQVYAVAAKGDRFLVSTIVEPAVPSAVTVVQNFDALLKR